MAPEYAYPQPIIDCYKVTLHVLKIAKELGVDSEKLILAGDSAGIKLYLIIR